MNIHFIYPYDEDRIAAPWSIGNNVARILRDHGHNVIQHDWMDNNTIIPNPGDILLGHPHPNNELIFCNSLRTSGWRKKIGISPCDASEGCISFTSSILPYVNHYFVICGPNWSGIIPYLKRKNVSRLDMAVNEEHYPFIKEKFNDPGFRKIAYIGCNAPIKGTEHLKEIHDLIQYPIYHFGVGQIEGTVSMGYYDFNQYRAREKLSEIDFLIMPGTNDPNPTIVLEACHWGIIPIISDHCGWSEDVSINFPLNDLPLAGKIIKNLMDYSTNSELKAKQAELRNNAKKYTWERFTENIIREIES